MWARAVLVVVAAGCGRIDFDQTERMGSNGRNDGPDGGQVVYDAIPSAQLCQQAGVFCDGFESGDLSRWTGTASCSACTVEVNGMYVHSGSYGLVGNAQGAASVSDTAEAYLTFAPRTSGVLAVRIWGNAVSVAAQDAGVLELAAGSADLSHALAIAASDARVWQVEEIYDNETMQGNYASTVAAVQGQWACFELDYTFGTPSQIQLFIDDALAVTMPAADTTPTFGALFVGAERATDSGAVDAIDDVVMASQHIGCN
jgi:hypothetical protein